MRERLTLSIGVAPDRLDFGYATRTVLFAMAAVIGAAAVVAILGLRRGVQVEATAD